MENSNITPKLGAWHQIIDQNILNFKTGNEEQRREAFTLATIPAEDDPRWVRASTGSNNTVDYRGPYLATVAKQVHFTYFQALLDIPENYSVTELKVSFDHVDDAARIYIFNSAHPYPNNGAFNPDADIIFSRNNGTDSNLGSFVKKGETNRIVIVQYNQATHNSVRGIKIELEHEEIVPKTLPSNFKLHAYSIHGKRQEVGSDYWMGYDPSETASSVVGRIVAPAKGKVLQLEKVDVKENDLQTGWIALKVLNAPVANSYLVSGEDKLVSISTIEENSQRHLFRVHRPIEKEAEHLNYVSLESVSNAGWYLRHQGFVLNISENSVQALKDIVYRQDATWLFEEL